MSSHAVNLAECSVERIVDIYCLPYRKCLANDRIHGLKEELKDWKNPVRTVPFDRGNRGFLCSEMTYGFSDAAALIARHIGKIC